VLLGHTPVVQSLARLGTELGFEVVVASAAVPADLFPTGVRLSSDVADALADADATTWVVVGTMGAGDEEALAAAASSDAAYVGLVASRKKARYLIDYVGGTGVPAERLARVKYPAGLDLGGMGAAEIALSVLAEIVQRRYGKSPPSEVASPQPIGLRRSTGARPAAFPIDPVCGMPVDPATARHTLVDGDQTIYFCCPHCKAAYLRRQAESTA
jgi:xanthine dehydrogenase accessory factor